MGEWLQIECNLSYVMEGGFPDIKKARSPGNEVGVMCNIVTEVAGFTELLNRDILTFLAEYNPTLVITDVTSNIINISTIDSKYFFILPEHLFCVNVVPVLKGKKVT